MSKQLKKNIKIKSLLADGANGVLNDLIIRSNGVVYLRKLQSKKSKCKSSKC